MSYLIEVRLASFEAWLVSLLWLLLLFLDEDLADENITQGHLPDSASTNWIRIE